MQKKKYQREKKRKNIRPPKSLSFWPFAEQETDYFLGWTEARSCNSGLDIVSILPSTYEFKCTVSLNIGFTQIEVDNIVLSPYLISNFVIFKNRFQSADSRGFQVRLGGNAGMHV